jgi:predicted metal-dependent HD superfamily phosphohydrolase
MNSVQKAWADLPPLFADRLMALLCDPARATHGLHHVNQLLLDADRTCHPHWLRPLRWAILYHVAIHDPQAAPGENQRASAELWLEHFPALLETTRGVTASFEADVAEAIRATATPLDRACVARPWRDALLDLVLGPLGAPPDLYEADRLASRFAATRAGIEPARWAAERRAFLERALAAPRLYYRIHGDREAQARENIARERAGFRAEAFSAEAVIAEACASKFQV